MSARFMDTRYGEMPSETGNPAFLPSGPARITLPNRRQVVGSRLMRIQVTGCLLRHRNKYQTLSPIAYLVYASSFPYLGVL